MSAILIFMDGKSRDSRNWFHGGMRPHDISDPHNPVLTGQVFMGGLVGKAPSAIRIEVAEGPQMFRLSRDGKGLYVTTSLLMIGRTLNAAKKGV